MLKCPKCKGFMEFTDVTDGIRREKSWRCINCGLYVIDKVKDLPCFVCGQIKCECKGKNWKNHIPKGK